MVISIIFLGLAVVVLSVAVSKVGKSIPRICAKSLEENDYVTRNRVESIIEGYSNENYVTCDTCGCLLKKSDAVRGESWVKRGYRVDGLTLAKERCIAYIKTRRPDWEDFFEGTPIVEEIVTPYYCKSHAPKTKKAK